MSSIKNISVEETLNQTRNKLLSSISEDVHEDEGIFSKIDSYLNNGKSKVETIDMSPSLAKDKSDVNKSIILGNVGVCQTKKEYCLKLALKNHKFCYKHILEDPNSPFQRCSYTNDNKSCSNPAPKLERKPSYCVLHSKEESLKNKVKKKKKKNTDVSVQKKRPSSLAINPDSPLSKHFKNDSSSGDEDFSFFTDTVHLKKTECTWLGNQASDADSTDSEDENLLNHAGVWTLEEALQIYKEKLMRLRHLYSQQYKQLHHHLKEEYQKFATNHDTDPVTLSKVPFVQHSGDLYNDYMEDVYLTNYQKFESEEIAAEKASKEKKSRGITLSGRRTDVTKCCSSSDGVRCTKRVLPLSKFCYDHILQDPDQYLYAPCMPIKGTCTKPADIINATCKHHVKLLPRATLKSWDNYLASKKARETRKRKAEQEVDKEFLKPTRVSARLSIIKQNKSTDESVTLQNQTSSSQKNSPLSSNKTNSPVAHSSNTSDKIATDVVDKKQKEFTMLRKKANAIKLDNQTQDVEDPTQNKIEIAKINLDTDMRNIIPNDNQKVLENDQKETLDKNKKIRSVDTNLIKLSEFASVREIKETSVEPNKDEVKDTTSQNLDTDITSPTNETNEEKSIEFAE